MVFTEKELLEHFELKHEHYLKRELISRELSQEFERFDDFRNIGLFGPPFKYTTGSTSANSKKTDDTSKVDGYQTYPLLRHFFDTCIKTFPFLKDVDDEQFWRDRVQPFIEDFAAKDISDTADRLEATKRKRMGAKINQLILTYAANGIQTSRPNERYIQVETERSMKKGGFQDLDTAKLIKAATEGNFVNGYDLNIDGVRQVSKKRGFFTEKSWEYLIRSQIKGAPAIRVARSYNDFKDFDQRLHQEFPGRKLPKLPAKHKNSVKLQSPEDVIKMASGTSPQPRDSVASTDSHTDDDEDDDESDIYSLNSEPINTINNSSSKSGSGGFSLFKSKKVASKKVKLPRERQRLVLRGYLRSLLEIEAVAKSHVFLEFIFKDRVAKLSQKDLDDIALRTKLDLIRIEDQLKFLEIAKQRARELEKYINELKSTLKQRGGMMSMLDEFKHCSTVEELSPKMQNFIEWVMVEFSATLYNLFVGGDNASEFYSQVRRIHHMMPYTVLRGILSISNPMAIMKAMMDLFLATTPFSKKSLLQSIFYMVLADDVKAQQKLISELEAKVPTELQTLLRQYVYAPYEIRRRVHEYSSENENRDLVLSIVEYFNLQEGSQATDTKLFNVALVKDWYEEWNKAVEEENQLYADPIKVNEYSQLKELVQLYTRKRDKEQMQELWSDEATVKLIREIVMVFYAPLVKIFKIANMSRALGDFERFADDLIRVVDKVENLTGSVLNANQVVEEFLSLCHRHQNSAFRFIHEVYAKDEDGLFDGLIQWISSILDFLRFGNGKSMDLVGLLLDASKDPKIDIHKVLDELNALVNWAETRRSIRMAILGEAGSNSGKTNSAEEIVNQAWSQALPAGGLEGRDFGLAETDLQEIDDDLQFEGVDPTEADNLTQLDTVHHEREYRKRLAKLEEIKTKIPDKPALEETSKLLPRFEGLLAEVLRPNSQETEHGQKDAV